MSLSLGKTLRKSMALFVLAGIAFAPSPCSAQTTAEKVQFIKKCDQEALDLGRAGKTIEGFRKLMLVATRYKEAMPNDCIPEEAVLVAANYLRIATFVGKKDPKLGESYCFAAALYAKSGGMKDEDFPKWSEKIITETSEVFAFAKAVPARNTNQSFQELDKQALQLFKAKKYSEAAEIWKYIQNDYPRDGLRQLSDRDPRFIEWQIFFYGSTIRCGLAERQVLLNTNPPDTVKADQAEQNALVLAQSQMTRNSNFSPAMQKKIISNARQPLFEMLKQKDPNEADNVDAAKAKKAKEEREAEKKRLAAEEKERKAEAKLKLEELKKSPEYQEKEATRKMEIARSFLKEALVENEKGTYKAYLLKMEIAKRRLMDIVQMHPGTKTAGECQAILKKLP